MKSPGKYTWIDTYTWIDLDRRVRGCTGQHLLLLFRSPVTHDRRQMYRPKTHASLHTTYTALVV